jgi:hypothetical protein
MQRYAIMTLQQRINAFEKLGLFFRETADFRGPDSNNLLVEKLTELAGNVHNHNGWFTRENVMLAIQSWGTALTKDKLERWTSGYSFRESGPKAVGLIMAGNIPLVSLHDMICILITGNSMIAKASGNDSLLPSFIAELLISLDPGFGNQIHFTTGRLKNLDAVIATGNNNSSRYFDYYFGKYPHIIRKNRNSVAVLTGDETEEELVLLGQDIFQYFGLGCRNVSKLLIPENYDLDKVFAAVFRHQAVLQNNKYANNYEYNKTIYLMNGVPLLENGFLLLKEDSGLASPVAVLYYEYYKNKAELAEKLLRDKPAIQCIVTRAEGIRNATAFGQTQHPELWDYSDGIDTLRFLGV